MKRAILIFSVALMLFSTLGAFVYFYSSENEKDALIADMVYQSLNYAHYDPQKLNDDFSIKVYDNFLKYLDYSKKFFTQKDIDELKNYRTQIDDQIINRKLDFFNLAVNLRTERVIEAESYYQDILKKPFNFEIDENIQIDDEKNSFAKDKKELKEYWRKALKYQVMLEIEQQLDVLDKAKETKDTSVVIKTFDEIEKDARAKVLKRNDDWFKRLKQINHTDNLSLYLNAISSVYDPHTSYFPPKEKADFDIAISGQLEGIGATLQSQDGYIKVAHVVPGSPSYLQGELKDGDVILKVAQGEKDPVDVVDMRLDDAVQLIRGKKGTTVKLTVKKVDGSIKVIPIVRDVVVIEETFAKSYIVNSPANGKKYGYIYLPSFYVDFDNAKGRRCSTDVLNELKKLKAEGIDGLVIDLRNNGGGSLQDVVTMAGYFIKEGPIVQVKQKDFGTQVLSDDNSSVEYDGPMVVMVNSNSASASEIFAAAMQDYNRAIIIGSKSTFGKGTVQRFLDFDQMVNSQTSQYKPLGSIKITFQKFYRINGGATQLKGVIPHIILPDYRDEIESGEAELDYHLAWDEINPAKYTKDNATYDLKKIISNSQDRINKESDFKLINDQAKAIKQQRDNTIQTLSIQKHREYQKQLKEKSKVFESIMTDTTKLMVRSLQPDLDKIRKDTVKQAMNLDFQKKIKKDSYLREAVNILNDIR